MNPKPIQQRTNECSLAALCVFNNLSQADYESISDLLHEREHIVFKATSRYINQSIQTGIEIARELGLNIPKDYGTWTTSPMSSEYDFSGKGIVYILITVKRHRKSVGHVVAYENNVFHDTNGRSFKGWQAYVDGMVHARKIEIARIYPE